MQYQHRQLFLGVLVAGGFAWEAVAGTRRDGLIESLASRFGVQGVAAGAAVLGALAVALLLFLRERSHRRRVKALINQLGELEQLWFRPQLAQSATGDAGPPELHHTSESPELHHQLESHHGEGQSGIGQLPRGPLSTAISSFRKKIWTDPVAMGPQRLDLRAIREVYSKLGQPMTPRELAEQVNVSLRTLQRHLAANIGCSPGELIVAVKMHEAKRRLVGESCQVQEVARAVGYSDAFHFSKRFRAYYGLPPSRLRAALPPLL